MDEASEGEQNAPGESAATAVAVEQRDASASPIGSQGTSGTSESHKASIDPRSLVGLTRDQVRARHGSPTTEGGKEWVYAPDQPGCRDMIVSEVVTFERDVVVSVRLRQRQTGKHCAIAPELR
jgi:hypothetical protein